MQRNHGSGFLTFAYSVSSVQVTGPARTHVEGIGEGVKPGLRWNSISVLPIELAAMEMPTSLLSTAAATGHMWLLNMGHEASATLYHSFQYCFVLINVNSYMWLVVTILNSIDMDFNQYPNYKLIGFENFLNLYFILFVLIFQNILQSFYFQFRTFLGEYLLQYLSTRLHFSIF